MFRKPKASPILRRHGLCRRSTLRRRLLVGVLICCMLWTTFEQLYVYHRVDIVDSTEPHLSQQSEDGIRQVERIFIASTHWNNEAILRSHWNDAVIQLARELGPDRIFVSVFESGSWDDSKGALRALDAELDRLGVRRNITLSETTHQDEISVTPEVKGEGWIDTPRRQRELRRIPYLARLRNLTLRPLEDLARQGIFFDKVLFLNDVVFTVSDVVTLLGTNGGNYAAACSLDFSKPPFYYDTFALRDSNGDEHLTQTWPYFRAKASRDALLAMSPVPVRSCWNGMVAMPIEPFMSSPPLRFRAISDSLARFHLEASECCLIHADNPLSQTTGVYLNPRVRVGYSGPAYAAVHPARAWISQQHVALALWGNRLRRWSTGPTSRFRKSFIQRRVAEWRREGDGILEAGEFCLVDEMQVVAANGWAHV